MSATHGTVVLLHGISRTSRIMERLERSLVEAGYNVLNLDYPSVTYSVETLAEIIAKQIRSHLKNKQVPLHFVGHSMGGIVIRLILAKHRPLNLGRVVMLSTPNKGSRVADFLQRFNFYRKLFGPAGQQIGTNHNGIHHDLPPADYECGIIAGDRSVDPWFSWFLFYGPNDGKVSVENAKLEGMTDFRVVHVPHAGLPSNPQVIDFTQRFLSTGRF